MPRDKKSLQITILKCWSVESDGSPIEGVAGVVDVISASFNTLALLSKKPEKLIIVKDDAAAGRALQKYPGALLIGESSDPTLHFSCNNNPINVIQADVAGKIVIQKTNNGTTSIADAHERGAEKTISFHWANLPTTADWLRRQRATTITLIASGGRETVFQEHGDQRLMEDWYAVVALEKLLKEKPVDYDRFFQLTKNAIARQYPASVRLKSEVQVLDLLFREGELFPGIVPLATPVDDPDEGIFEVTNALTCSSPPV